MGCLRNFGLLGNRLRSTHCRAFFYIKLCRPAYFVSMNEISQYKDWAQYIGYFICNFALKIMWLLGKIFVNKEDIIIKE